MSIFVLKTNIMPTSQELFNDSLKSAEKLKTIDNFYNYEEAFAKLHTTVRPASVGKKP